MDFFTRTEAFGFSRLLTSFLSAATDLGYLDEFSQSRSDGASQ
jgi:hypothetical protein